MNMHGFTLIRETQVKELSSRARLWKHDATGAQLLSFCNVDENKVFGVSFRTPPPDSTGVAHILEHSVLCGSEKYPVKEPFVELLKGSLQTFLNAFTYPDKTCYPVASANRQDFYNLMDVYMDAVFFPRITEDILKQEGWHYEADTADGPLTFKGVVYNEMKGVFSSPEAVMSRQCLHNLFPDNVYGLESGGDPEAIPDLTYEAFKDFHRRLYHPTNSRFYFWGDDPEDVRLEKVGAVLSRFKELKADSTIGIQPSFSAPRRVVVPFASGGDDKGMVVVNWLCSDVMDVETSLAFKMLDYMLLGMPASPLRRALIESGFGEDLAGQGLEAELRQLTYDVGLKGIDVNDADKVEALILDTLAGLVKDGLPDALVEAAVNTVEFSLRENNTGRYPVGLAIMLRSLTTWLHDGDPLAPLQFEAPLAEIKRRSASGERYFEGLLSRWFIENTHRVTVILSPDAGLGAKREQAEKDVLDRAAKSMSREEREAVVRETEFLKAWQAAPDTEEGLATIPRLSVSDLPLENAKIPSEKGAAGAAPILFHPLPTGGISYVSAAFDVSSLSGASLQMLPMMGRCLLELGTKKRSFEDLNMTISCKTGGMDSGVLLLTHAEGREPVSRMLLEGKVAPDKVEELFALMREVLNDRSFDHKERFSRMVLEEKARLEHGLIPSGHSVVSSRLRGRLSRTGYLGELTGGVSYLLFIRELVEKIEKDWKGVLKSLEVLADEIFCSSRLCMNVTALDEQKTALMDMCSGFAASLPAGSPAVPLAADLLAGPRAEAFIVPAQVNYVGKGINLCDHGYKWHGSSLVIMKQLRTGYLWEKVRVQGGAYGAMCSFDRMNGSFVLVSYRDPNILPTLAVYDGAADYLRRARFSQSDLNAAIVGAIGEIDSYMLPDAKGSASFARHLIGDTEQARQKMRDEALSTTADHFRQFGEALADYAAKGAIAALGGQALARAAEENNWQISILL